MSPHRDPSRSFRTRPWQATGALLLVSAVLGGCATATPYQAATQRGTYGYNETQLADNRYRIIFRGNAVTPSETTQDYALLRAADLTVQKGYDWFRPTDRNTAPHTRTLGSATGLYDVGGPATVVQHCGLLTCNTVVSAAPRLAIADTGTSTQTDYASSLEIIMGKNPQPEGSDAYDARQLAQTLRAQLEKPATPAP